MLHKTIGKYRIEDVVGSGGMSIVYYAFDEQLNRPTALKVLHKHWAADQTALRRFKREALIAQRLDHPNIIKIYEHDEIDTYVFLAMEYIAGGSLAQRFRSPATTTLGETAAMLTAIARGLDYAHGEGVIHRDLKMENILVAENDRLVLSDFGIAKMVDSSRITESGMAFGTPLYISPEQIQGAKNVDFRTDLYSFAVIAYLLTTGYHPFSGSSAQIIAVQHIVEPPPLPSNLNPRLPERFNEILLKGLAKEPQNRYQSAGEMADAFAEAAANDPLIETVVLMQQLTPILTSTSALQTDVRSGARDNRAETILFPEPRAPHKGGSRLLRLALVAVLLALMLVIGIFITQGGLPFTPPPVGAGTAALEVIATEEPSASPTATQTATQTASQTATRTVTPTRTPSRTPSQTTSPAVTPTLSSLNATRTQWAVVIRQTQTAAAMLYASETAAAAQAAATEARHTSTALAASTTASTTVATTAATNAATSVPIHAPATSVPPTAVPPTSVPPTAVPPTSVPPTAVPPTTVPPTAVPPTSVPPTAVPPTAVPPTVTTAPLLPPILPTIPIVSTLLPGL